MAIIAEETDRNDRIEGAPVPSEEVRISQKALDWLFGYDYFIAHRSIDGKDYASALYDALTGKGNELDCFLDVKHYGAGGRLTNMQARALRKTTRLIVIVTPHAHDADAPYLRDEVAEFTRIHREGIIVPIGTSKSLSEADYPDSQLLPLLPRFSDAICILEPFEEHLVVGTVSSETTKKLLNDFSEERRSTKRLRWIRRVAALLLALFVAALALAAGFGWQYQIANVQRDNAIKLTSRLYGTVEMIRVASQIHPDNSGFAITEDASAFVTLGKDGTVQLWRIKDMSDYTHLSENSYKFIAGRFGVSGEGKGPPISLAREQMLSDFQMKADDYLPVELPKYGHPAEGARFSPNGTYVATWGDSSVLRVSSAETPDLFSTSLTDAGAIVFAMPNESGRIVMVQTADGSIIFLNTQTKQQVLKTPGHGDPMQFIDRVSSFNDRRMTATLKDSSLVILSCSATPSATR